ncbi:MAG: hypothetical protein NTV86_14805 [Planctomycetota bacterium]|nr:hypothetical protein [Planctomycetota bacterium]
MIDFSNLLYVPDGHVWHANRNGEPEEVVIGGTESGPDEGRLALAKLVSEDLDVILTEAKRYVASFMSFDKLGAKGELWVIGLEFGRLPSDRNSDFHVLMSLDHDDYGLWEVTVRRQTHPQLKQGFYPVRFSRTEW